MGGLDDDAIDWTGRNAERASAAKRRQYRMHSLGCADDCIDWARRNAQRAADARGFVDTCNDRRAMRAARGVKRLNRSSGERCQCNNGLRTAGRTTVDVRRSCRDGFGIGSAGMISAAGALRLRQQRVDTVRQGFLGVHR